MGKVFPGTIHYLTHTWLTISSVSTFAISTLLDRFYYGTWTFPAIHFLYFNIAQSLAVFYGSNPWHYYLSQGVPLLLTTVLPFAALGFWTALRRQHPHSSTVTGITAPARFQLAVVVVFATMMLSFVSHKEVRFIYPLLPLLHLFAAEGLSQFTLSGTFTTQQLNISTVPLLKKLVLASSLLVNVAIALYTTRVHQAGVISVLDYLRHEHEHNLQQRDAASTETMSVGFLMPCHSTPWRSHLVHPDIKAWALGCEPPVNMAVVDRESYVDEADRFYDDPSSFMRDEIGGSDSRHRMTGVDGELLDEQALRWWPDYVVIFAQLKDVLRDSIQEQGLKGYEECWRGFNTHWHDDWRRKGDVVVWCRL